MKFRLLKASEYSSYCEQLKIFEEQFNYPIGEQKFQINHGSLSGSYFTFFSKLRPGECICIRTQRKIIRCRVSNTQKGNQGKNSNVLVLM
jgi:hypothetical protein